MKPRSWLTVVSCSVLCLALGAARAADAPKKAAERKPQPVNAVCPVSDDEVDKAHTVTHKGKVVAFCCEDCIKSFKKSPDKFMKKVEAEEAKKKKADKKGGQPAAEKGKPVNALCPVEKEHPVDPTVATSTYQGRTVGFCCEDCIKKFDLDPDAYAANLK